MPDCRGCTRPITDAAICPTCKATLDVAIAHVAEYHAELDVMRSGLARFGTGNGGSHNGEARLGLDIRFCLPGSKGEGRATTLDRQTRAIVNRWATYCDSHYPHKPQGLTPSLADHAVAVGCKYLKAHSQYLATSARGGDVYADMLGLERRLAALIDRPADKRWAGLCGQQGCERQLWADPDATEVTCRDCGTTYNVADKRAAALAEAEDYQATVSLIAQVVAMIGDVPLSRSKIEAKINTWAYRDRITSHGTRVVDGRARPLYRIGDVLALFAKAQTRRGMTTLKGAT